MSEVLEVSGQELAVISDPAGLLTEVAATLELAEVAGQGVPGPRGPVGPSGGAALTVTTDTALGGHRVVYLLGGMPRYADCTVRAHGALVLGLSTNSAAPGGGIDILRGGEFSEPSWTWVEGTPVYLGLDGLLTQSLPLTAAFSLIVGFPITPTKLFISIREPIFLI